MMDTMALPQPRYHHSNQQPGVSPDPPIDPTLAIDPAILAQSTTGQQPAFPQYFSRPASPTLAPKFQFEQGPQGDPFAPQQQDESFFHPRAPSPPRPLKRKRKTRPAARRDDDCSFCQGDDSRNKNGQPEEMVSCVACGRSGHPSCLGIEGIADILRSYPWHCIECKICEVCDKKGNGNRMLFCDACDRGWHMDCLDPPLDSTPDGSWICPHCPPIPAPPPDPEEIHPPSPPSHHVSASPAPSIASSSRLPQQTDPKLRSRKGKRKIHDDSEGDDEPPRVRHKPEAEVRIGNKGRGKAKGKAKGKAPADVKGKGRARTSQAPDEPASSNVLPRLRVSMRAHHSQSPDPPALPTRKVRLVVRKPKVVYDEDGGDNGQDDGSPGHMFEGILKPEEYSTSNTAVHDSDKSLFNRSRTRAELKLGPPVAPPPPPSSLLTPGPGTPIVSTPTTGPSGPASGLLHSLRTRHSLAQALHSHVSLDTPPGTPYPFYAQADTSASVPPRIRTIRFGEYDVDTWYDAPFPEEYASVADGRLWMCEFCLKYMKSRFQSTRHRMKCKARHPPGDEIYRDGTISVFEVDGRKNKIYCQNLCLLSKMFLDHKSLFYDVEPFLFYVMTEVDRLGARFVGYFSKEKRSPKDYNVSCIMTLPVRQRRGWGNILIDFSYLLSKKENRVGSPERPLSALGALAYRQYWTHTVKLFLHTASEGVRLEDISQATAMTLEDVYNTLREQNFITAKEVSPPPPPRPPPGTPIKYLRGRKNGPGVTRRGLARTNTKEDAKTPLVIPTEYTIHWGREELDAYVTSWRAKEHVTIQPRCLKWSPFLLARARKSETVGAPAADTGAAKGEAGRATVTEVDRSSASSTNVTQGAPLDVAVLTPNLPGESSPLESTHVVEQSPSLTVDVEDSKPSVRRSSSPDASQVVEDHALAAELARVSESPHRLRTTRSKSLHEASADRPRPSPAVPENARRRTLRSRTSAYNMKRTRNTEDEDTADCTADEMDLLQDGTLVVELARDERPRGTRSTSYKTDPPKPPTPRASPRKRRRVESSTEPEPEPEPEPGPELDAEGSLSELTRTSASPSPSPPPPPRRVTRAINGQNQSHAQNGISRQNGTSHGISTRSTRADAQPLATGVRSSSRINGATRIPSPGLSALRRPMVIEEAQDDRARSTRRGKAESLHDDAVSKAFKEDRSRQTVRGHQPEEEEAEEGAAAGFPASLHGVSPSVNGKVPNSGTPGGNGTPGMYDEDALGEEDAEGEEDPNPESDAER